MTYKHKYNETCDYCKVQYETEFESNRKIPKVSELPDLPEGWESTWDNLEEKVRCPACIRQNKVIQRIVDERRRQDKKWGTKFSNSAERWLAILAEEFGEAAMAVVDRNYEDLDKELIQVAAVCVKFLEFFDPNQPIVPENM